MQELGSGAADSAAFPIPEPPIDARSRRFALLIVCLVMVIDLLGFGIVLPMLPRYGKEFLEPLLPGDGTADRALRGVLLGALMSSFSLMQFIFAPIWGRLSDRWGRRPFLLLGLTGSVVFYALFGFASGMGQEGQRELGLILLFVARIGAGIAGATVSTAQAVIADTTTPEKRRHGMALIGASFGIGFALGPILSAAALKLTHNEHSAPGYLASAICLLALFLGYRFMPETRQAGAVLRRRQWFNFGSFRLAMQMPTVGLLILAFFLSTFSFGTLESTLAFLTKDVLQYSDEGNLWIFSYVGFVLLFSGGGLYQMLARRGMQETTFMLAGIACMTIGMAGVGLAAKHAHDLYASAPIAAVDPDLSLPEDFAVPREVPEVSNSMLMGFLGAMTLAVIGFSFINPSVSSLVSRRSNPNVQGEILGVNQSANAIARILGPMFASPLYYLTPSHLYPYLFAVLLLGGVFVLTLRVREPALTPGGQKP